MKMDKEWVSSYFEYGVDPFNRRVFLWGDIEEDTIANVVKGLYFMEAEDPEKEIEFFISSCGGSTDEMFGLYDFLNTITCPVSTIAMGKCLSAAPLLVAAGKKGLRYAGPNTVFMVHEAITAADDERLDSLEKRLKQWGKERIMWADLMAERTKKDRKFWLKETKAVGDAFFTADQAIDYGVVDHIWSER